VDIFAGALGVIILVVVIAVAIIALIVFIIISRTWYRTAAADEALVITGETGPRALEDRGDLGWWPLREPVHAALVEALAALAVDRDQADRAGGERRHG
jgi:uncharacterized membrane protein YqiK